MLGRGGVQRRDIRRGSSWAGLDRSTARQFLKLRGEDLKLRSERLGVGLGQSRGRSRSVSSIIAMPQNRFFDPLERIVESRLLVGRSHDALCGPAPVK